MLKRNEDSIDILKDLNGKRFDLHGEISFNKTIACSLIMLVLFIIVENDIKFQIIMFYFYIIILIIYILYIKYKKKKEESLYKDKKRILSVNSSFIVVYKEKRNINIDIRRVKEVLIKKNVQVIILYYDGENNKMRKEKFNIQYSNKNLVKQALKEYLPELNIVEIF
ncbi:MAG: hypothetical protein E7313_01985 [Clostridiales bacterium]|nr:hypothetical protein [Clostridiales bacterium]